jgi:hypothetical protein
MAVPIAVNSLKPTCCNMKQLCILPKQCIYLIHVIITVNRKYFQKHVEIGHRNGHGLCYLWVAKHEDLIFKKILVSTFDRNKFWLQNTEYVKAKVENIYPTVPTVVLPSTRTPYRACFPIGNSVVVKVLKRSSLHIIFMNVVLQRVNWHLCTSSTIFYVNVHFSCNVRICLSSVHINLSAIYFLTSAGSVFPLDESNGSFIDPKMKTMRTFESRLLFNTRHSSRFQKTWMLHVTQSSKNFIRLFQFWWKSATDYDIFTRKPTRFSACIWN